MGCGGLLLFWPFGSVIEFSIMSAPGYVASGLQF